VPQQSTTPCDRPATPRHDRKAVAGHLDDFRQAQRGGTSGRQFARDRGLPRSTLQGWARRLDAADLDPALAAFLGSAAGLAFVHRLVTAAHLVFCLQGPCGLRLLSAFLRLARLDRAAAASLGACHARQARLEQAVVDFAQSQRERLARGMAPRDLTVAEDETYHPACCLVALDAGSGFLLVEQYAAGRDRATWDAALAGGLAGLEAVTVRQVVGDQARGLVAHARQGLGVPHSPDLFHAQRELTGALAGPLAAQAREARGWLERLQANRARAQEAAAAAAGRPRGPGRPVDHAARVGHAEQAVAGAQRCLAEREGRQEALRQAVRGLGEDDHPVDLATGCAQGAEAVRGKLEGRLAAVGQLAAQAGVAAKAKAALKKVRAVVPGLVAAVAFFWERAEAAARGRFGAQAWGWAKQLVCGQYLRRAAGQAKGAQRRGQLRALAEGLLAQARLAAGPAVAAAWGQAERWALEVAGWFARSSSAVEGRNGQLALHHHGLHRLPDRKLRALTAVHNYWLKRADGTTAAERFFGRRPDDLFEYLVEHLPVPARPAKRRTKAA
jgi:hypothetical protein